MSSSIFSFELVGRAMRLPGREKGWIATLVLACTAVVIVAPAIMWPLVKRTNSSTTARDAVSAKTQLISIGTSHVNNGIRPAKFDVPTVCLSSGFADYSCLLAITKYHIDQLEGLKVAIVEVEPLSFTADAVDHYIGDYRRLFDIGIDTAALKIEPGLKRKVRWQEWWYQSYFWPLVAYRKVTPQNILWRPADRSFEAGFEARTARTALAEHAEARAKELYGQPLPIEHIERNRAAFTELIRLLVDRNVKVVLVWTPKHESLLSRRPASAVKIAEESIAAVKRTLGEGAIQIWNDERVPGFTDEEFSDSDHLHEQGADKYSSLLNERVMRLVK